MSFWFPSLDGIRVWVMGIFFSKSCKAQAEETLPIKDWHPIGKRMTTKKILSYRHFKEWCGTGTGIIRYCSCNPLRVLSLWFEKVHRKRILFFLVPETPNFYVLSMLDPPLKKKDPQKYLVLQKRGENHEKKTEVLQSGRDRLLSLQFFSHVGVLLKKWPISVFNLSTILCLLLVAATSDQVFKL